ASRLRPAARTEHQGAARRLAGAADRVRGVLLRALRSPLRCRGGAPRLSGCRGGRASAGGLDDDLDNPHLVQDAVRPSGGALPPLHAPARRRDFAAGAAHDGVRRARRAAPRRTPRPSVPAAALPDCGRAGQGEGGPADRAPAGEAGPRAGPGS
ncbi:hypothetical protein EMIHUDRAFT_440128, partial [Emiliania huxleyi CCMP1516]|uniref:Uncharacterized protein n=2 Tax=Emiliania huxleyi TaxID=2903 RepID=A0A0D3KRW0_EMIH1